LTIKVDQKNTTGREKGNGVENKVEDIENKGDVALFNFLSKKKILVFFGLDFVQFVLEVFERGRQF